MLKGEVFCVACKKVRGRTSGWNLHVKSYVEQPPPPLLASSPLGCGKSCHQDTKHQQVLSHGGHEKYVFLFQLQGTFIPNIELKGLLLPVLTFKDFYCFIFVIKNPLYAPKETKTFHLRCDSLSRIFLNSLILFSFIKILLTLNHLQLKLLSAFLGPYCIKMGIFVFTVDLSPVCFALGHDLKKKVFVISYIADNAFHYGSYSPLHH